MREYFKPKLQAKSRYIAKPKSQILLSMDTDAILRINAFCDDRGVSRSQLMMRAALKEIEAVEAA